MNILQALRYNALVFSGGTEEKHEISPSGYADGGLTAGMDLPKQDSEIWELFTRKEEHERCGQDRYDRFPYYRSRHQDLFVPRASQFSIEKGYHCEYPDA